MIKYLNKLSYLLGKKKNIIYVDSITTKNFLEESLQKENLIAIDTEFDWRNTYYPILSMIQISTYDHIFLLDYLKWKDLDFLKRYLEKENKKIIFHSSRSDTTVLSSNINLKIKNSYDIQIGEKFLTKGLGLSYGSLVETYFGIKLEKGETNSNWLKRPLSDSQIQYAAQDVEFLIGIYKIQKKQLNKLGFLDEVESLSNLEADLGNKSIKEMRVKKFRKKYKRKKLNIYSWREMIAENKNIPPSYVFKDNEINKLMKLDLRQKDSRKKLMSIMGDTFLVEKYIKFAK